ncbi:MAG: ATP-dependent DNA helicase RecG [Planctomycetota bacterium]
MCAFDVLARTHVVERFRARPLTPVPCPSWHGAIMVIELFAPVTQLPGVGPARAAALARLGIYTVRDLLLLRPRRLASAALACTIAEAAQRIGREVTIAGVVERTSLARFGRRSTLRVTVSDESSSMPALFFNQPWLQRQLTVGLRVELRGRVVDSRGPAIVSPKIGTPAKPLSAPGSLAPLYPSTDGIGPEWLRGVCQKLARELGDLVVDPLPDDWLRARELPSLASAVSEVHAPTSAGAFDAAGRRLALERLLGLSARLHDRRRSRAAGAALAALVDDDEDARIRAGFPFEWTRGQRAVGSELRADLARTVPMRRLLQGDVGSGKTALGIYACRLVAHSGGQAAFVAPTELLAEQHFAAIGPLLRAAGLSAVVVTGSLKVGERRAALAQLESGMADVAVGTHALFGDEVRFRRLALAVIDEQQRFGVAQRARILDKGADVHALLMTATPIPRTLALTLYGDLETSTLAERPPGRGLVRTRWVRGNDRRRVPEFLRERLEAGERVYWVVPRIGAGGDEDVEAERDGESSAELAFERLSASPLARFGLELVHGRIGAHERNERLERFRSGAVQLLVATTVIEVGVDVPEATVLVIENAERLGLAQLHQLRGRVGRGARDSWCLLFGRKSASERFLFLESTSDGFVIAEEDLRRRGMGDLAGVRQAGENAEGIDVGDTELLLAARDLVAHDPRVFDFYRATRSVERVVP